MSEVSVNVSLSSAVGLTLRNSPTVIKFYPGKTSATIKLYINDATLWTSGTTTNMVFTPANSDTYAAAATIPVTATSAVVSLPTAVLVADTTDLK